MASCGNCGVQLADNAAFCPNCGKAQPNPAGAAQSSDAGPSAAYNPAGASSSGLAENVAGMLAYFTIIPAILFLLIEPYNRNRFVRFHSFQCLFVALALFVVDIALAIASSIFHLVPLIGWFVAALIWLLYSLAIIALWLLLVVKAYRHEIFKLPVVGELAEKQAGA
jgi:uncharacterized membrane protein